MGVKGLAMPGTEKTKLKGNGMVADAEDDGGKQGAYSYSRERGRHCHDRGKRKLIRLWR